MGSPSRVPACLQPLMAHAFIRCAPPGTPNQHTGSSRNAQAGVLLWGSGGRRCHAVNDAARKAGVEAAAWPSPEPAAESRPTGAV